MHNLRTPAQRGQIWAIDGLTDEQIADWLSFGHNQSKKSNASSHQANANSIKNVAAARSIAQNESQDVKTTNNIETGGTIQPWPGWWDFPIASNTGNLHSAYQDPHDSRNERPKDLREQEMLHQALETTVEQFLALTGRVPNPALFNPQGSYFSQWYLLQAEFEMLWAMNGSLDSPRLSLWGRWTGGISRWCG